MTSAQTLSAPYRAPRVYEEAIRRLAPRHIALPNVPDVVYPEIPGPSDIGGCYVVSADHSDRTIYSSPSVNHAFRAWHDRCHFLSRSSVDARGEYRAFLLMSEQLARVIPNRHPDYFESQACLWADTEGLQAFHRLTGRFPENQAAIVGRLVVALVDFPDTIAAHGAALDGE